MPDEPPSAQSFKEFGFPVELQHALGRESLTKPFPIQQAAIPIAMTGRDVLGRAPTGSGKTLAFGLPMLTRLISGDVPRFSPAGQPRAMILAPTRELADQIFRVLEPLAAPLGLRCLLLVGGVNIRTNLTSLARPVDVIIATPGRVLDLLRRRALSMTSCAMSIVDEADHMADLGFLPQVSAILDATPSSCQHLLFSATLDGDVATIAQKYLNDPARVESSETPESATAANHPQAKSEANRYISVSVADGSARQRLMRQIASKTPRTMFFVRTTHSVGRWAQYLSQSGIRVSALHGNRGHQARKKALADFAAGRTQALVATDVAARGIDIDNVPLVVHIDVPEDPKAFIHRSGRTGRAGTRGTVMAIAFPDQNEQLRRLAQRAGLQFQVVDPRQVISEVRRQ